MRSRVFRVPAGLDISKYQVREDDEAAVLQYTNGDTTHPYLENEAANRVPKIQGSDTSLVGAARGARRKHKKSVRRSNRSVLPVRQKSKRHGSKENEGRNELLGCSGPCCSGSDGRWVFEEEDSLSLSEGTEGSSKSSDSPKRGENSGDGRPSKSEDENTKCFLDKSRSCNSYCKAFADNQVEPCKLLDLFSVLKNANKQTRPTVPTMPTQQKLGR